MKNSKMRISRVVTVSVIIAVIVVCMVIPATATPIDYEDYIVNIGSVGDSDIITVEIPADFAGWQTQEEFRQYTPSSSSGWYHVVAGTSTYKTAPVEGFLPNRLTVRCYPFGLDNNTDSDELSLANIPDGTKLTFNFTFDLSETVVAKYYGGLRYYANGKLVEGKDDFTEWTNPYDEDGWAMFNHTEQAFTFTVDKAGSSCTGVRPLFEFQLQNCSQDVTFSLASITFEISISSAYREYVQTGKTNKLLETIEDKLEEQGTTIKEFVEQQQDTNDKLDEIINGTVTPEKPSGSGSIDDLEDVEDNLLGGVTDNFGEADSVLGGATQIISRYGSAFLAVGFLFGLLIDIPFINDIIMISFALGIFATLLGVGLGAISSHNKKAEKATKGKGG